MIVSQNTYPKYKGIARAEIGEEVEWQTNRGKMILVRLSDRTVVFSRDCYPRGVSDERPVCGTIAEVKSKRWRLSLSND